MSVPAVQFSEVTKRYGDAAPVLEKLSTSVGPGEFVSIIGPSGCGKSTLLKLVSGLSPVTSGQIAVDGMTPAKAREIVSFIFQDAAFAMADGHRQHRARPRTRRRCAGTA